PKDKPVEDIDISKFKGSYPLEPRLVSGRIYIFRKTNQVASETMALKTFPERLTKIGAHITRAPKTAADLMRLIIGGPLFSIEFEIGGHSGRLFNRVADPQEAAGAS